MGTAARPLVPLLGLVLVLGFALTWGGEVSWRRALAAGLLVLLWAGFSELLQRHGTAVDVAALALLPFTTRRHLGLLHAVGMLGTILGIAVFGMRDPDRRLYLFLEWGFQLSNLCLLAAACRLTARVVTGVQPTPASEEVEAGAPRWVAWVRGAAIVFALVGSARIAWLTATTDIPPLAQRFLTKDEAAQTLRELARRNPGLLSPRDLAAPVSLTSGARSPAKESCLAVFPARLGQGGGVHYLPASARLAHWAPFFQQRPYDRTVCFFQFDGMPYPKYALHSRPVILPGKLPDAYLERDVVVVCRIVFDSNVNQEPVLEGIALIPVEGDRTVFEAAHVTAHPLHPGTPGYARP